MTVTSAVMTVVRVMRVVSVAPRAEEKSVSEEMVKVEEEKGEEEGEEEQGELQQQKQGEEKPCAGRILWRRTQGHLALQWFSV